MEIWTLMIQRNSMISRYWMIQREFQLAVWTLIIDGLVTLDWFLLGEESFKIKPPLSTHRFYHSQLLPNHIRNTTTTFCSLNLGHPGAGGCGPLPNKWLVFSWGIPVPWEPKQKLICEAWLKYFPSSESKKQSMNWRAYTLILPWYLV